MKWVQLNDEQWETTHGHLYARVFDRGGLIDRAFDIEIDPLAGALDVNDQYRATRYELREAKDVAEAVLRGATSPSALVVARMRINAMAEAVRVAGLVHFGHAKESDGDVAVLINGHTILKTIRYLAYNKDDCGGPGPGQ